MKTLKSTSAAFVKGMAMASLIALPMITTPSAHASTIWNGPVIAFYHSTPTGNLVDHLTAGVSISRSTGGDGLYNTNTEGGASSGTSPADTKWAVGSLANFSTLTYGACPLEAGNHPPGDVGKTYVVHLVAEDIYLSLTLTNWGGAGGGGDKTFGYIRSTPAVVVSPTPTISLTNPAGGAVFAAPANVRISANAAVSSGTVTNVQFFTNNISFASLQSAPFTLTANNLAAGAYALTAAATAAGISATSAVVNVTVVTPATLSLATPLKPSAKNFQFSYPANIGLTYVVQRSTNLATTNWIPLVTNTAASNPVVFVDLSATNTPGYYRVGRLPNP